MERGHAGLDRDIVDTSDTTERFLDDPPFPEKLGIGGYLLPLAATALVNIRTERLHTVRGGRLNPLDMPPEKRAFPAGDANQDSISGNTAGNEHDTLTDMPHGIAAEGECLEGYRSMTGREGFGFHSDHAMIIRDQD
jgi:hypothetical protein